MIIVYTDKRIKDGISRFLGSFFLLEGSPMLEGKTSVIYLEIPENV